jgi:hypothetical protein
MVWPNNARDKRMKPRLDVRVGITMLGLTFLSSVASVADYCTKEQYERDRAQIAEAFSSGRLVKGPKGLRDSILMPEDEWYKLNYLQQIVFMQSYECSVGQGKPFLYLDVRSLSTGKLLATWKLGALEPADGARDSNGSVQVDKGTGVTGQTRADFITSVIEGCRSKSVSTTFCSCYANALADSLSAEELRETSAAANPKAAMSALRPKIEAAAKRCQ